MELKGQISLARSMNFESWRQFPQGVENDMVQVLREQADSPQVQAALNTWTASTGWVMLIMVNQITG